MPTPKEKQAQPEAEPVDLTTAQVVSMEDLQLLIGQLSVKNMLLEKEIRALRGEVARLSQ